MHNDSIETLLLRHYGSEAPVPVQQEQRLLASVRQEAAEQHQQQRMAMQIRERRISRRSALKLVAFSSAGMGLLSSAIGGLQLIEGPLSRPDLNRPAFT